LWRNPYADLHAKKQIFLAIPANLLLWGCETWALRQSQIDKLNVFWHRAIRKILGITTTEVIDDHITNERIRKIFHDIPDAETILNARTMTYLGKTVHSPDQHPPKLFMTAWVQNPRPKSGVLSTNKKAMVRSLNTLLPEETTETIVTKCKATGEKITTRRQNPDGKLSNWLHIAMDKQLWEWHIHKLTHPNSPLPPRPDPARPRRQQQNTNEEEPNSTNAQQNERQNNRRNNEESHHDNARRQQSQHRHNNTNNQQQNEQSRQNTSRNNIPEPSQNHTRTNYNVQNVGRTRTDSLLALGLDVNATNAEIKRRFQTLSLIYHPDKYNESIGITKTQATEHFQILNNAHDYLKETR
jgi:flagellar biosynthesis GTPase FlhF